MAAEYNITILQGATFNLVVNWEDEDGVAISLSGYTVAMSIKTAYGGTSIVTPTITITDAATGEITVTISATNTAAITADYGVYDIELTHTSTGTVVRLMQGAVIIDKEVTT
jgi:hypothetical protein